MAAPMSHVNLALRGSQGIRVLSGPPNSQDDPRFTKVESRNCKVMSFSGDGEYFAFCDGRSVSVLVTADYQTVAQIDKPRTVEIKFSPCNTFVATWEPYFVSKDNPHGSPNLNIWELKTGKHVRGLYQKRHDGWAPQWSADEKICGRNVNNEVQFFEENVFDSPVHKLHMQKVSVFQLTEQSPPPYHVAVYVPGTKGQPSFIRIFRYPNFGGHQSALANKSFYLADKVDLLWNNKGSALLVLTSTESSADSYYGDQGLHFVSIGGESCLVPRGKNGPVYCVEWNPRSTDFCVVYGFMPAKATLYNLKCEPVFDFGTGPRNLAYFNPQGNVLSLAGFGNLGGNLEFWDLESQKLISRASARDTTFFEWCPDGKHIVTATTSPRLRVGNGFKLWDFNGQLLCQEDLPANEELWDVLWQSKKSGVFRAPHVGQYTKKSADEEKPKAYVPPAARNRPGGAAKSTFREDYEPPSNLKEQQTKTENLSKAALKNRKKREAKARAKEQQASEGNTGGATGDAPSSSGAAARGPSGSQGHVVAPSSSSDPEKDKKIRNINKKIRAIEQLKEQQAAGKQLELNQIEKIKTLDSLLQELEKLELT